MIIREILLTAGLLSSTAYADQTPHMNINICSELDCEVFLNEKLSDEPVLTTHAGTKKGTGGFKSFVNVVATNAGKGIEAVTGVLSEARQAARDAGLKSMNGSLNFNDGSSVSFEYHFDSGRWSVSGGPGGKQDDLFKVKPANEGQQ